MAHPVIILFDNDAVISDKALSPLNKQFRLKISTASTEPFYHLTDNLYLVKTPERAGPDVKSCIEDMFDTAAKAMDLNGKVLHVEKDGYDHAKHIGKMDFAKHVVAKRAGDINWDGFMPLLDRIVAVLDDYRPPITAATTAAPSATRSIVA